MAKLYFIRQPRVAIPGVLVCFLSVSALASEKVVFELEGEKTFSNEIDVHHCQLLRIVGHSPLWVFWPIGQGDFLTFRKCLEETYVLDTLDGPVESRDGEVEGWYMIDLTREPVIIPITAPRIGYMSQLIRCQNYIAYWGVDGTNNYFSMVYDLQRHQTVAENDVGSLLLETDNQYHFPPPQWDEACLGAIFKFEDYEVTLRTSR